MANSIEGFPPEMQARIASIVEHAKANTVPPVQAPAPVVRQPSLMDHVIALRQEVAELRQQVHASAQVTEAVGQAVGQLYQMFCQQTETTDHSSTYTTQFQQQALGSEDF